MSTYFVRFALLVILYLNIMTSTAPLDQYRATIQAVPPGVSLTPMTARHTGSFYNISPFLTNTLLQAIADESENKKRVQRYRDIEK